MQGTQGAVRAQGAAAGDFRAAPLVPAAATLLLSPGGSGGVAAVASPTCCKSPARCCSSSVATAGRAHPLRVMLPPRRAVSVVLEGGRLADAGLLLRSALPGSRDVVSMRRCVMPTPYTPTGGTQAGEFAYHLAFGVLPLFAVFAIWRGASWAGGSASPARAVSRPADAVVSGLPDPRDDDPDRGHHRHLRAAGLRRPSRRRARNRCARPGRRGELHPADNTMRTFSAGRANA